MKIFKKIGIVLTMCVTFLAIGVLPASAMTASEVTESQEYKDATWKATVSQVQSFYTANSGKYIVMFLGASTERVHFYASSKPFKITKNASGVYQITGLDGSDSVAWLNDGGSVTTKTVSLINNDYSSGVGKGTTDGVVYDQYKAGMTGDGGMLTISNITKNAISGIVDNVKVLVPIALGALVLIYGVRIFPKYIKKFAR